MLPLIPEALPDISFVVIDPMSAIHDLPLISLQLEFYTYFIDMLFLNHSL